MYTKCIKYTYPKKNKINLDIKFFKGKEKNEKEYEEYVKSI